MQSFVMLNVIYAERHIQAPYADCHYAECRGGIVAPCLIPAFPRRAI